MTDEARADAAIRMAKEFQARLAMDILSQTSDANEQTQLAGAVLGLVIQRVLRNLPINRAAWLSEVVRVGLA
jgi:hypothetical protein